VGQGGAFLLAEPGQGESLSAQEIVRRYQRRIYAVIHRMIGSRGEVEDLCQDTFLQILRNPSGLAQARDRDAWVYRIAMNVAIDFLRRKVRDRGLADKVSGRAPAAHAPGSGTDSESAALRALDELSPQLRQVVILRIFEGLSHEQIAMILDASVGTIRWRLFEARRKLGELLGPYLKDSKEG
jgi:RNA polymerase sigma-70 factor, ECF subfamily